MKITIEFSTESATFDDSFSGEVTKILQQVENTILESENITGIRRMLKDDNGNRIGVVTISHD